MLLLTFCYAKKLHDLPKLKVLIFLGFVQVLCSLLIFHGHKSWYTSYDDWQRTKAVFIILLNAVIGGLIIIRANNLLAGVKTNKSIVAALDACYLLIIAIVLYKTYQLASDGRYISFPFEVGVIPITGLLGLFCIRCLTSQFALSNVDYNRLIGRNPLINQRNKQLSWLIAFYSVGLVAGEIKAFMVGRDFILAYPEVGERLRWAITYTLTNAQLLGWLVCLAIFALSFLVTSKKS
jgi:hypothetical protein